MEELSVKAGSREYRIIIGSDIIANRMADQPMSEVVKDRPVLLVTDSNVVGLYGSRVREWIAGCGASAVPMVSIPAGEPSKNIEMLRELYRTALADNLGRDAVFAALGGGVVGDLAGFAAATFMRGVDCVQIPTSLLAMVDSSVGGKVGVDLEEGKNLVGAFHQPRLVAADVTALQTLPVRELRCGLAEVIKYGVIMDREFFELIEANCSRLLDCDLDFYEQIIKRCCELKAQIVAEDEREQSGRRAILNYGHTFGHAIESLTGYSALNHGEAVAAGMTIAAELARSMGMVDDEFVRRQTAVIEKLGLPTEARNLDLQPADIIESLTHDKKARAGKPYFVLPSRIGSVELTAAPTQHQLLEAIGRHCG